MFQQDADSAAHLIRIHVTALSCHMICHAMRLKGLTQLPQHVTTTTSYSHKEYRCDVRWTKTLETSQVNNEFIFQLFNLT